MSYVEGREGFGADAEQSCQRYASHLYETMHEYRKRFGEEYNKSIAASGAVMKIEYQRLNHITIAVPAGEHDKVRAFYGGLLGLKEVERPDALNKVFDLIWYEWFDILLHLEFTPPWTTPAQNRHVGIEIKNIDRVRASLAQQGAKILEAVAMPDRERFYLLDPFGNYFEFIEINNSTKG